MLRNYRLVTVKGLLRKTNPIVRPKTAKVLQVVMQAIALQATVKAWSKKTKAYAQRACAKDGLPPQNLTVVTVTAKDLR